MPIEAELGAHPLKPAVLNTITLKLDHGKYEAFVAQQVDRGTYTIDAGADPKSITVVGTEGPNNGKTFPAIYQIKGDTLRICYDLSGAKRPREFKTLAGTQIYLVTYQRKK